MLGTVLAAGPAQAVGQWGMPVRLASYGEVDMAVPAPGTGAIVYSAGPGPLYIVSRSGTGFSRPRQFATWRSVQANMTYDFDARGRALMATRTGRRERMRIDVIQRSPTGRLTRLRAIRPGHRIDHPTLAVARSGAAIAAWVAYTRRGARVEASIRARGRRDFGPPRVLSRTRRAYPWPNAAIGDRGDGVVAWHWHVDENGAVSGMEGPLWAATSSPRGRWGGEQRLGDGREYTTEVSLSVSPSGRMLAAWSPTYSEPNRAPAQLLVAERAPGTDFSRARVLSSGARAHVDRGDPVAAVADDGRALVAWVRPIGPKLNPFATGSDLEVLTRAPGADFVAQGLTNAAVESMFPVLAVGEDDGVALGWTERPLSGPEGRERKAHLLVSIGTFGMPLLPPSIVSRPRDDAVWPKLAVSDEGDIILGYYALAGDVLATVHER